jgi:hypothetical protein
MLRSDNTVTTKRLVGGPSTGKPAEETKKVLVYKGGCDIRLIQPMGMQRCKAARSARFWVDWMGALKR